MHKIHQHGELQPHFLLKDLMCFVPFSVTKLLRGLFSCVANHISTRVFPQFNQVECYLGMGSDNHRVNSIAQKHNMIVQAYSVTGNE